VETKLEHLTETIDKMGVEQAQHGDSTGLLDV
jgi:hypothetical protein